MPETSAGSELTPAPTDAHVLSATPLDPACLTSDLPAVGGAIGPNVEHFVVDELPAYLPSGTGEHWYVRVEKRGLTTLDLVRGLSRVAGVEERDIGHAGMKDKQAVTSQWLSLPGSAAAPETWELPDSVRVLEVSRHINKLRTGHLRGNRFSITLVGVSDGALQNARAIAARLSDTGLLNYFGAQRYGRGGENLGRAREWLRSGGRRRLSRFLLKLLPSVVQSEVFDRYLALRAARGLNELFAGEVVRLEGSSAHFLVEDAQLERPRLTRSEIHLTGPMPGPKMRAAHGLPAELEREAIAAAELDQAMLQVLAQFAPGARRDLLVRPQELEVEAPEPGQLVLKFGLPAGSYATVLVREFTRAARLAPEERSGE